MDEGGEVGGVDVGESGGKGCWQGGMIELSSLRGFDLVTGMKK